MDDLIDRWAQQLATENPDAVAVFLKGSHARGTPEAFSDVDFDLIVTGGRNDEFPWWLDDVDGRLVHVSVAVRDADAWLAEEAEPARWALGFPSAEAARLIWVRDADWRRRLDRYALTHPATEPELEEFVAEFGKMANARALGDELALRAAAQRLANYCPRLLLELNAPVVVGTAREALAAALDLTHVPAGYREDMLICLGLAPRSADEVFAAANRLVTGTVDLVNPDRDLARYLHQLSRG